MVKLIKRFFAYDEKKEVQNRELVDYAIGVFKEFGFFKGFYLMIRRLIKCNHFSSGGYDPIPFKNK